MSNLQKVNDLIRKIRSRNDLYRTSSRDMDKLKRLYAILEKDIYYISCEGDRIYHVSRSKKVAEYKIKLESRLKHINLENSKRIAKKIKTKDIKACELKINNNVRRFKQKYPVVYAAQCITCDIKRTNIIRRIDESLSNGVITSSELIRLYKVVGLSNTDRRELSKRLSECGLIARKISSKRFENLVKSEILKMHPRIMGTKIDKLTLISINLDRDLDEVITIYKKLSIQESIDRRNKIISCNLY